MDFAIFDDILDSIVLDPRERVKAAVRHIVAQATANVPPDFAAEILRPRLGALGERVKRLIEKGRTGDVDDALTAFRLELINFIVGERTREGGRLRPITAVTELKKHRDLLSKNLWGGGYELEALEFLIADGDTIERVDRRTVEMASGQKITRELMRAALRPRLCSERQWLSNFVSDAVIREAEEREQREARELARPFRDFSGPQPIRD